MFVSIDSQIEIKNEFNLSFTEFRGCGFCKGNLSTNDVSLVSG